MPKLLDLFAAAEAVGQQHRHSAGRLDSGQESLLGDGLRYRELLGLEPEWPGHAAAAGLDLLNVCARATQQRNLACRPAEDRLVMTMPVYQNMRTLEPARHPVWRARLKPVSQQPDLLAYALCAIVVREELEKLILEHAGTTRLEKDEWNPLFDSRSRPIEHIPEICARLIEKAKVVQWPTATDMAFRGLNAEACILEHRFGSKQSLRMVVVVPCIRPEKDWPSRQLRVPRPLVVFIRNSQFLVAAFCKLRQRALRSDTGDALDHRAGDAR